jgi:hypothetical protein
VGFFLISLQTKPKTITASTTPSQHPFQIAFSEMSTQAVGADALKTALLEGWGYRGHHPR